MESAIYLPWWAWAYLIIALIVFALGWTIEEMRTQNNVISSSLSLFTICTCVVGFYNPQIPEFLGLFLIPMVGIGIYWEIIRVEVEKKIALKMLEQDLALTDDERDFLLNTGLVFNALIIVPGYVMGLFLCFNVLGF